MSMMKKEIVCLFIILNALIQINLADLIDEDPSLWPGHFQTFGTGQNSVKVDTINHWPSPEGNHIKHRIKLFYTYRVYTYCVYFSQQNQN